MKLDELLVEEAEHFEEDLLFITVEGKAVIPLHSNDADDPD